MIDLSISIVNTNNWKYLEPCLRSILENTKNIRYEILVVDNASEDGSAELIREKFPGVILSTNDKRYGFAKNNNINLQKSTGRYLMLLNDDTIIQPGSLENAVKFLDENEEVGMVGCKMVSPDGTVQVASGRRLPTFLSLFWKELGISYRFEKHPFFAWRLMGDWDHLSLREIELPSEAGMIVRRSVIDQVGLLDEQFFMYGEGADWCRRIRRAGWNIMFLPSCSIVHFGNTTNQKLGSIRMHEQYYKSSYLYFRKESWLTAAVYRVMVVLVYSLKYLVVYVRHLFAGEAGRKCPEILNYYWAAVKLMIFKLNDPDYPFQTRLP